MEEREGEKRERERPQRRLEDGRRVEARLNKIQGGKKERETEIQRKGETKPGKEMKEDCEKERET